MRTAEESSGTVLHRLIQEQLRYGNPTDARTLLAIQQQALRGGGGAGSPRSSLESLTQEESQFLQMSTRQEPQGQEHQGDYRHSESPLCHLHLLHGEELPTYEEAKAHSQYLASQRGQGGTLVAPGLEGAGNYDDGLWEMKREHARSLSERLMQLSLERNSLPMSSSHSYPQLGPASYEVLGAPQGPDQRGPPPDYPSLIKPPGYMLSHSQEHGLGQYYKEPPPPFHSHHLRYTPAQLQTARHGSGAAVTPGGPEAHCNAAQMESVMRENESLRMELEAYTEKAARLQKLELEIQRISEAYETLMKGSAKRENLEKTMRNKLESEIKRLHDFNRDLRERLETASKQRVAKEAEAADQSHHVFAKLLEQNEEQQCERERLEREIQRLRSSGEEWRRRGEALEQALGSAQARSRQLEEELRRKRAYVEKVERLQSALGQLQVACEKREALEFRLRTRLEQELKSLRVQQWQTQGQTSGLPSPEAGAPSVQQQLRQCEERVLALEADITRWEQKYLEERTMRQFAMDAAATAAAQRDTTIIKHSPRHSPNQSFNDEPPVPQRHQEMENRIRALHAQLLEKDAVIKVLHQRSRREQPGLRPAQSVPSISSAVVERGKGKSLSDDQTPPPCPHAPLRPPHRDFSTQCDVPPHGQQLSAPACDQSGPAQAPPSATQSPSSSSADLVEILI